MQARCRRSIVWVVPFLMVAGAGWAGARSAAAADLQSILDEPCAQSVDVAALAAPEWAAQETGSSMGTEAPPAEHPAMGTEPSATGTESSMAKPAMACTTNAQCHDKKMWCSKPNGHCKGKGECMAKPEVCPDVVDPVCGCNGKTYNNECMAHRAGVNVSHAGKCKPKHKAKKSTASKATPATPATPPASTP